MAVKGATKVGIRTAFLALVTASALSGCATSPPDQPRDACAIFKEKSDWYEQAEHTYHKWGVPIQIQLAIMYQESRFRYDAKTPRDHLLWVIPWGRVSSAYGFAQVKDGTWNWYRRATGNSGAERDDFADASDFIGWYVNMAHRELGISKWDGFRQYLAYHEGIGGYRHRTYRSKGWLIRAAHSVEANARRYGAQLRRCQSHLGGSWWWPF